MYNVTIMLFFKFLRYLYGGVLCSVHYSKMSFDDQFAEEMSSSSSHGFQITRKAKKRKIDAATYPEVLEMSGEFDKEVPETVVQKHFFNRENEGASYKHVSPWDHSFVASFIQRSPIPTFNMNDNQRVGKYQDTLEGVTRKHEERFMVEASGDQRRCCMAEECEGKFISEDPDGFVLREFLLPSQEKAYEQTKRYPIQRAPCILCKRLQIARLLVSVRAAGTGMREDCIVQDYYNFVNIPGEYRLEDCLLSKKTVWEGIVSPVVLHVRNAYKFVMKDGKRGYTQWKMPFLRLLPESSSGTSHSSSSEN